MKDIFIWRGELLRKILHIAVPSGIENGLFALGKVLVTSIVALFGTAQIAANGVANSIDQIAIVVVNAVNLAMITVVGQCIGAQMQEQAEYYTRKLMKISYVSTGILGAAVCALLPLILNALYALAKLKKPPQLVKAATELRLAALAGYLPELSGCCVCGDPEPDRFSIADGTLECASCRASDGVRMPLSAASLAAMRYIVSCPDKKLFSFALTGAAEKELCDAAESYLLTQLERSFYTLDFYKSLLTE